MELKEILAISGQSGLFKFVAQSKNGIIVESLADGHRSNASASTKVSSMTEIAIFTQGEDMPLAQIFEKCYEHYKGAQGADPKSTPDQLKAAFAEVLPLYDRERVHVSDIKKVFMWYNILVGAGMTEFKIEEEKNSETETEA